MSDEGAPPPTSARSTIPTASPEDSKTGVRHRVGWLIVALTVLVGTSQHLWYYVHKPLNSDEAVVGLMAEHILQGHFTAFFWGQHYGGVEPYITAAAFALFGKTAWALVAVPTLLGLGSSIVTWRIALRISHKRVISALAGALVWAAPQSGVIDSTTEFGFRAFTLLSGLLIILLAIRLVEGPQRWWTTPALGLFVGLSWWSSPESAYFLVPVAVILGRGIVAGMRSGSAALWIRRLSTGLFCACLGAMPWLWDNVASGFSSISSRTLNLPIEAPNFAGRFAIFLQDMFPMLMSVRLPTTGTWLWPSWISISISGVMAAVICGAIALCVLRGSHYLALGVGLFAFPYLLAFSPSSWYWQDGRYAMVGFPLLVLVLVLGLDTLASKWKAAGNSWDIRARLSPFLVVVAAVILVAPSMLSFSRVAVPYREYLSNWGNPNAQSDITIRDLEMAHIRDAYASYWVAFRLDFLSTGALKIGTVGNYTPRWASLNADVEKSKDPGWIFVKSPAQKRTHLVGVEGPDTTTESRFLNVLDAMKIGYTIRSVGSLHVVLPEQKVNPVLVLKSW